MEQIIENLGLVGMIIQTCDNNSIVGRKRLQKMIYFSEYLGWNVGDYHLHHFGPFSPRLEETLRIGTNSLIFNETKHDGPYEYQLTDKKGIEFMKRFREDICDKHRLIKTQNLLNELTEWETKDLELASTIDFVHKNDDLSELKLLEKVQKIKTKFSSSDIKNAYKKWKSLKELLY